MNNKDFFWCSIPWGINIKKILFTCEKNGLNKTDLFFHGIEESVIRFSVRYKENELHRKYKGFGGSTENASLPPILEIEQIYASIGFSTPQSIQKYPVCSFIFENKFYMIFWISHRFLTKQKQLYEFIKTNYLWIGYLWILFDTHFIPLQNQHSPILVGPKLGRSRILSAGKHFSDERFI